MPYCKVHKDVTLICMACAGAKGGASKSKAKTDAARQNAAKALAARQRATILAMLEQRLAIRQRAASPNAARPR